jgi:hypothetical protein
MNETNNYMEISPEEIVQKVEIVRKAYVASKAQRRIIYATFFLTVLGCAFGGGVLFEVIPIYKNINKIPSILARLDKSDLTQDSMKTAIGFDSLKNNIDWNPSKKKRLITSN